MTKNRVAKYMQNRKRRDAAKGLTVDQLQHGEIYAFDSELWIAIFRECKNPKCPCGGFSLFGYAEESEAEIQRRLANDPFFVVTNEGRLLQKDPTTDEIQPTNHFVNQLMHVPT